MDCLGEPGGGSGAGRLNGGGGLQVRRLWVRLEGPVGGLGLALDCEVAEADGAGSDDAGVDAAEAEGLAGWGTDEAEGLMAEALGEFGAAGVGFVGDFEHGVADGETGARGQVLLAQVDVDDELIAGEGPAVFGLSEQSDEAGVDDGDLGGGVGAAIGGAGAAAGEPAIADQAGVDVQRAFGDDLSLVDGGSLDDHLEGSAVGGGLANVVQAGFQLVKGQLGSGVHGADHLPGLPTQHYTRRVYPRRFELASINARP